MTDGSIEYELGVPIPGRILPAGASGPGRPSSGCRSPGRSTGRRSSADRRRSSWTSAAATAVTRSRAPRAGPITIISAIDILPVVIRYATRRANQRGLHNVRFAVKDAETFLERYVADVERRRGPPLPSPALSRPSPLASSRAHAAFPGRRPSGPGARGAIRRPDRQSGLLVLHDARPPRVLRVAGASGSLARRPGRTEPPRDPGAEPGPADLPRPGPPPRRADSQRDRGDRRPPAAAAISESRTMDGA